MKPKPPVTEYFTLVSDANARHQASMDPNRLYNNEPSLWQSARKGYLTWPGGGPELLVLEGSVYGIPREGWIARFNSSEEAEKVLLAAGFRPTAKPLRYRP